MKPLIVGVFGPTACRKSEFALELASELNAQIINCDSVQVYQQVQIGANKPTAEELAEVPHHLFDFVAPPNTYTAGQYHRDFHQLLAQKKSSVYFMVGGSGFYARAALQGLYPVEASQPERRKALTQEWNNSGSDKMFQELLGMDPEYAKVIGPKDQKRIIRALEILRFSEFKSITELEHQLKSAPKNFRLVQLAFHRNREDLRAKIAERTESMLSQGLIAEVDDLIKNGLRAWAPLRSVGYAETVEFLEGRWTREQLSEEISRNTARLAKRQMTWLRGEADMNWFDIGGPSQWDSAVEFVRKLI